MDSAPTDRPAVLLQRSVVHSPHENPLSIAASLAALNVLQEVTSVSPHPPPDVSSLNCPLAFILTRAHSRTHNWMRMRPVHPARVATCASAREARASRAASGKRQAALAGSTLWHRRDKS